MLVFPDRQLVVTSPVGLTSPTRNLTGFGECQYRSFRQEHNAMFLDIGGGDTGRTAMEWRRASVTLISDYHLASRQAETVGVAPPTLTPTPG